MRFCVAIHELNGLKWDRTTKFCKINQEKFFKAQQAIFSPSKFICEALRAILSSEVCFEALEAFYELWNSYSKSFLVEENSKYFLNEAYL